MSEATNEDDYLETCQGWQKVINALPDLEAKQKAGREAMVNLNSPARYDGRQVIVKAQSALFIPDGTGGFDEQLYPLVQFGELTARGWLGRLSYVKMRKEGFLAWSLFEPSVLGPVQEEWIDPNPDEMLDPAESLRLPIDIPLQRTLHFPVSLIDYSLSYAPR